MPPPDPFASLPPAFRRAIASADTMPEPQLPTETELDQATQWAKCTALPLPDALELVRALGPGLSPHFLDRMSPSPPERREKWWNFVKRLPIFRWVTYFMKNARVQ